MRTAIVFGVGLLLFAAAVWAVTRSRVAIAAAWDAAHTAPAWMVVLSLLLPGVNWLLSSSMFYTLTRRYGDVGRREMGALLGSAWLLNMLPARPGLAGRIAYHRAVNGIPLTDSGKILVQATSCTGIALGAVVLAVLLGQASGIAPGAPRINTGRNSAGFAAAFVIAGALAMVGLGLASRTSPKRWELPSRLATATTIRLCDALVWALRYWLLFRVLGRPLDPAGAMAIAAVSMAAGFMPVPIGLREWVVGLTAAALPPEFFQGSASAAAASGTSGLVDASAPGLAADLVMRACDLLWAIPVGLACTAWLWRRWQRSGAEIAAAKPRSTEPPAPTSL